MPAPVNSQAVTASLKMFQRLLAAYPKAHREEYGSVMAQLFRDQCRDAWRESHGWGLVALWLRVLPDLVKTSVLEHLATLNERKPMLERIASLFRPRSAPLFVFIAVSVAVFFLVVITATLVTFIMPESFASTARLVVRPDGTEMAATKGTPATAAYDPYFIQAEFGVIQSEVILGKVIEALDLNSAWGKKYSSGAALRTPETLAILKARLDLRPVRNTSLIEIRVFGEDPQEAAKLANAVADAYRGWRQDQRRAAMGATEPQDALVEKHGLVEIVDRAVPGLRPVRPNKPLNIVLGVGIGGVLAVGIGTVAIIALIVGQKRRRQTASS